jgi:hypothetical protein
MRYFICFVLSYFVFNALVQAQDQKSRKFKIMIGSENELVRPYGRYDSSDSIFSQRERKKITRQEEFKKTLVPLLKSIVSDQYYTRYKERSIKGGCGYYTESDPRLFDSYSDFKGKLDLLTIPLRRLIERDKDLIGIKVFTDADEFILLNELFLYNKAFQPKTIDDVRIMRNATSLCVMCNGKIEFGGKVENPLLNRIGFADSKYSFILIQPIESETYLCDIEFTYLK